MVRTLWVVFVLLLGTTGCWGGLAFWERGEKPAPTPVVLGGGSDILVRRGVGEMVPLTKEAEELRRLRQQHGELIKSLPAEPTEAPTPTLRERQRRAGVVVIEHPEGVPVGPEVVEEWFNPTVGLSFYREEGGDWTSRKLRESHTHRRLFYFGGYPAGVRNFQDGSIFPVLARELGFEAVRALPLLGEVTPGLVDSFTRGIGWEVRDAPGVVINVWSEFEFKSRKEVHRYVAGGVMEMRVKGMVDGDEKLEYLEFSRWVGPVVVERLPSE